MQEKEKKLGIMLFFVLALSLLPLYIISGYAHPSVDDYSYGKFAAQVFQATGSFAEVLKDAWQRTGHTYQTWQGTFSSVFLMRLQPAVFGEQYYFLTTTVLLSSFVLGSMFFYMAFFCKLFCASFWQGWLPAVLLSLGAVQFTHVPADSFYWYNGGITYTFFYSLEMLLFALLIFLYRTEKRAVSCFLLFLCMVLAFFTCGGNYVTSLITVEILFFACVLLFLQKSGNKKLKVYFLLVFLCAAAGFLTAVLAPGNAVRQEEVGKAMNPVLAVLLSFVYGFYSFGNCVKLPVLLLFLTCIPVLFFISGKSSFSFRYPALVTFFSICLYSSQITPVIYAQGLKIPYRIMNIIYFSCFVMVITNLFYWIGYFGKTKTGKLIEEKLRLFYQNYIIVFYAVCFLLICFTTAGNISIQADVDEGGSTNVEITQMPASVSAVYSLINGEAAQYDDEAWERYFLYTDPLKEEVVVSEFSVKPEILFHSDITENPKNWKNRCVKKFFGKKSVRVKKK